MFTRENLDKLHSLTAEVGRQKEIASEQLKTAQDRNNHVKHKIERDGKKVELTEHTMWTEVFHLGPGVDSGKILAKLYPEVFEAYALQDKAAEEMKKHCVLEFGVDFTAMTISDYLKLTEGMLTLLLSEKEDESTTD